MSGCSKSRKGISRTSSTFSRSAAVSTMSGYGRPRPASCGDSARSTTVRQPSASMTASAVERANPVVSATLMPADRSTLIVSAAPGIGVTAPSSTSSPYASSNVSLAAWARRSSPFSSRRNTSMRLCPLVFRRMASIRSYSGVPGAMPSPAIATVNACWTRPSSRTVVPAMSRHASCQPGITGKLQHSSTTRVLTRRDDLHPSCLPGKCS